MAADASRTRALDDDDAGEGGHAHGRLRFVESAWAPTLLTVSYLPGPGLCFESAGTGSLRGPEPKPGVAARATVLSDETSGRYAAGPGLRVRSRVAGRPPNENFGGDRISDVFTKYPVRSIGAGVGGRFECGGRRA